MRKTSLVVLGVAGLLAAGAAAAWLLLSPRRTALVQERGGAAPASLHDHCKEAIGEPRVERVSEHVWLAIGFDLASTVLVHTPEGNVVVDVGMSPARAREARAALLAAAPGRIRAIVYTHSHIDHVGGASAWTEPGTEIWATAAFLDHFVKQYGELREAEARRGAAQYGVHVDESVLPCSAIGRRIDLEAAAATGVRMPTRTFSGRAALEVGGVRIELVEAHGETHDQLFAWLPGERTLLPGDNYYRAFPNLYTIRGTSPRPVDAWIDSLDRMRRLAPEHLAPSHTVPLHGQDRILGALTRYRDGIQWVRDRVIQGANAGRRLEPLVESIGLPPALAGDPALAPRYGQIDWSARAIYGNHLGWFDGSPEALYPLPAAERARKSVAAMGGAERVWAELEAARAGDPRWALHLLGLLRDAGLADDAPGERWARASADALAAVAASVGNTNGRGYLLESAAGLRGGAAAQPTPRAAPEVLDAIPLRVFFRIMASRLDPELAAGVHESVAFELDGERFFVTVRNGVAEVAEGSPLPGTPAPLATVRTGAGSWRRVATAEAQPAALLASGALSVEGDRAAFYTFTRRFRRGL